MIEIKDKDKCCGCNACAEICPKKCIELKPDKEGFWYPDIDKTICVDCKLCEKVCPVHCTPYNKGRETIVYGAYNLESDVRAASSSGGIFTLVAEWVLKEKGIVFGAAFEEDFSVKHISVDASENLWKLQGSKYSQSDMTSTYSKVKSALGEYSRVLFSGTACQIAGLKNYLGREYDNLYTIDILCHGVPSPKVWKKYLDYQKEQGNSEIKQVIFRSKENSWRRYEVKLIFENDTEYKNIYYDDSFMRLFLSNICLRPSCHSCVFKEIPRCSDITLGDFWGIDNVIPQLNDDKGTSIVLVHTQKGNAVFEEIRNRMKVEEVVLEEALPISADSRCSVQKNPKREKFFGDWINLQYHN